MAIGALIVGFLCVAKNKTLFSQLVLARKNKIFKKNSKLKGFCSFSLCFFEGWKCFSHTHAPTWQNVRRLFVFVVNNFVYVTGNFFYRVYILKDSCLSDVFLPLLFAWMVWVGLFDFGLFWWNKSYPSWCQLRGWGFVLGHI